MTSPPDPFQALWQSCELALRAEGRAARTLETYGEAARQFRAFLIRHQLPLEPARQQRGQVEDFIAELLRTRSAATARARYVALRSFYGWAVEEQELERSPMERMKAPEVDEPTPQVLTEDELRRLLKACAGRDFESRRDLAIIRLYIDSGSRRSELAGLTLRGTDLDAGVARITGKGGREEKIFFGSKSARDIDRYLRLRASHPHAANPQLWLAQRGALSSNGIYQMIKRRALEARLERNIWPHLFRHTFGHMWKAQGGSEEDLMQVGRWRDPKSMRRYGRSAAEERARAAHRQLSPGDRL
jgi:integrase/recombinase XerC